MKAYLIAAAAASVTLCAPMVAQAADSLGTSVYGTLGYANAGQDGAHLSAIQGRLGARFGQYIGVEGEVAAGLGSTKVLGVDVKLSSQYAAYGVVFMPLSTKLDGFVRVGYGRVNLSASYLGGPSVTAGNNGVSVGGGMQYFFTKNDGIRAEYTYTRAGGNTNVLAVAYVRKF